MEVIERTTFTSDMGYYHAMKQTPQNNDMVVIETETTADNDDDSWTFVSPGGDDNSFVDQLLNLEFEDGIFTVEEQQVWEENERKDAALQQQHSSTPLMYQPPPLSAVTTTVDDDLASVLSVPAEEADLEWVSQFMEDSNIPQYSYYNTTKPNFNSTNPPPQKQQQQQQITQLNCLPSAPLPLSKSRRSKRSRLSSSSTTFYTRNWPYPNPSSPTTTTHFPTSSSSSSYTSSPPSSPSTPLAFDTAFLPTQNPRPNPPKKHKTTPTTNSTSDSGSSSATIRRCSHCGVQKTPQWRAGPMGAKTLCNACGVRFKSGRLFPEYRPACSPTFSSEIHSNSHRKVLEMRKKREDVEVKVVDGSGSSVPDSESGVKPGVSSG